MNVMLLRVLFITLFAAMTAFSQQLADSPPIEPGVSQALAQWRAARYSDVRYKLNLTLEKMSPVLNGTLEIRVKVRESGCGGVGETKAETRPVGSVPSIILDWRKNSGHEKLSTISNVTVNGASLSSAPPDDPGFTLFYASGKLAYFELDDHLIFRDGVVAGENVIKLDFTSPILTSGSAITRYVDKEDGAEYIYSLFVPSDASTAFPVFDQPDLKARFHLSFLRPSKDWKWITNTPCVGRWEDNYSDPKKEAPLEYRCEETKPISTYVFAFVAGPFQRFDDTKAIYKDWDPKDVTHFFPEPPKGGNLSGSEGVLVRDKGSTLPTPKNTLPTGRVSASDTDLASHIYVRKSQAAKFKPHAAEVFRLNREGIKYLETYFDYKFPFPKYDLVLIPEFPFGGMEHAGATFLREASIIFPTEPTKSDYISRANLIFHEAAHQWFGDTVTMRWFDDLWLKEGFAEFMAYKTLEKVMPDAGAWKVFYERNKQAAYLTDSTKGTTPIYQKIDNLSAAKSAYGNIVYRKAPSFLRQAEFYLGEQKFQTAARAFLKKHEYANAGWEDLVGEFGKVYGHHLDDWGESWVKQRGLAVFRPTVYDHLIDEANGKRENIHGVTFTPRDLLLERKQWTSKIKFLSKYKDGTFKETERIFDRLSASEVNDYRNGFTFENNRDPVLILPNYQDYGYGIFLLDAKSRDYVLKNIQNEKDPFLRSMMWGSLWDSVREAELDPKVYVELVIKNLPSEQDETIVSSILGRVGTAMNYYITGKAEPPALAGGTNTSSKSASKPPAYAGGSALNARLEAVLLDRLQHAPTAGQRITFYRAFVTTASTAKGREVLKEMLAQGSSGDKRSANAVSAGSRHSDVPLRTKDRFDIVTRLIILGDPDAPKLLAQLEKTETGDDAKRYAYAARAGIVTAVNKAKYWSDFTANKDISESWIEAAFGPFNSVRHSDLTVSYLERALAELPTHKRTRKIFFVNGWLGAFIGGQKSEAALAIVNKFLADNPNLDHDLRLKILENVDLIERAVKIRSKYGKN